MKKIKLLLRYGLACSSLTISFAIGMAQIADETNEPLPPIVQVANETSPENSADAAATEEAPAESSVEAVVDQGGFSAPYRFDAASSPFHLQPLTPIFEAVPIVRVASASSNDGGAFTQPIGTALDGNWPPIVSPGDASSFSSDPQEAVLAIQQIQHQMAVPPAPQIPNRSTQTRSFSANVPNTAPTLPSFNTDFSVNSREAFGGFAQSPSSSATVPASIPTIGGATLSGYDHRGRCSHCGGAGCEQCTGAVSSIHEEYGAAPVMTDESIVVPGEGSGTKGPGYECCGFMNGSSDRYLMVDFLYYQRADATIFGGNFPGFEDFDWTRGGRVTIGHRFDCNSGREISLMGFDPWIAVTEERDAGARLFGNLASAGGFPASSLSSFRNATYLEQLQKTDFYSGEINNTYWAWDVVKTFYGVRYMYFDDEYRLSSANAFGEQGYYFLDTTNYLFGPHLGWEMFYDIGYRLSFSFSTKLGGYANVHRGTTAILNDGDVVLNATDKNTSLAGSAEIGFHGHYQILPRVRARFGYDVLGLWEVATTEDNFTQVITPTTGLAYEHDDNAFFHGVFAGVEFYR